MSLNPFYMDPNDPMGRKRHAEPEPEPCTCGSTTHWHKATCAKFTAPVRPVDPCDPRIAEHTDGIGRGTA